MRDRDARRSTNALRELVRRVVRPGGGRQPVPVLTVVVPVYNVAEYLPDCLDSLLGQSLRELEVIAVDDGSTDGSLEVLRRYAERDHRLQVLSQPNSGQGIARNRAVAVARGEFLTFCDGDDMVPKTAYAHMVETLRRTGSQFCVGAVRRFTHQRKFAVSWAAVHDRDILATTIDETPLAMQDIIACNRMFRTAFWRDRIPPFRGVRAYEDHVPMLAAYVRATSFDVLARVTYRWRIREDNTSVGQQKAAIENLLDRIAAKEEARELLLAEASPATYDAWIARTVDVDFQPFIEFGLAGGDMYRNVLSAVCQTMFDRATPAALARMRYRAKVRAWLCATGEWSAIVAADDFFRRKGQIPDTRIEDGRVVAVPGPDAPFLELVPQRLWDLSPVETGVTASLRCATWAPNGDLHLIGPAHIRALREAGTPQVQAWLLDRSTGTRLEGEVLAPPSDVETSDGEHDLHVRVPVDALIAATASLPTSWALHLQLTQGDVVREGGVHEVIPGSSAVRLLPRVVDTAGHGALTLSPSVGDRGLEVEVAQAPLILTPETTPDGRLGGHVHGTDRVDLVVERHPGRERYSLDVGTDGRFEVPPLTTGRDGTLRVLADLGGGAPAPIFAPAGWSPTPRADGGPAWILGATGSLEIAADGRRLLVDDVRLTEDSIVVELAEGVAADDLDTAELHCDDVALAAQVVSGEPGATLVFPRRTDRWGTGTPTVPAPASFTLTASLADGRVVVAEPGPALEPLLPATRLGDDLRLELRRRASGQLGVVVAPPLQAKEASPEGQHTLRAAYRRSTARAADVPAGSVLLLSSGGRRVDGNPLAIDAELARSRPELTRYWAVRSHATAVPPGAAPVLVGSARWYDVLRSVDVICTDGDMEPYFEKRPHQRVLQTFRGRPWKAMGRTLWRHQGLSEERMAAEIDRRRQAWDAIVAPDLEAATLYRAELDFTDQVIAGGTPEADGLIGIGPDERDAVRRRVLDRLGVPGCPTVVLYAPTYRESLSRRVTTAGLYRGLDLDLLTTALGPDHVVLLRAHQHDRRDAARIATAGRVLNVTDFPDVTALMHTADVAVLDYSSLRFEWALTGRPAICFVPDLDAYTRVRPPLGDYAPTAPGPLVTTTEEVVALIRDLPSLIERTQPEVARFNERFNANEDGRASVRVVQEFLDGQGPR